MPKGFLLKRMFWEITKYYDAEVFIEADVSSVNERNLMIWFIDRVEHIAELFGSLRTLTKKLFWHLGELWIYNFNKTLGGLNFFDDNFHSTTDGAAQSPLGRKSVDILCLSSGKLEFDINSKTGLIHCIVLFVCIYQKVMENDDNQICRSSISRNSGNNIYATNTQCKNHYWSEHWLVIAITKQCSLYESWRIF